MRRYIALLLIILLFISVSGCTSFGKSGNQSTTKTTSTTQKGKTVATTPTTSPPKYSMGDIVKKNSIEDIGKVVLSFDTSKQQYTVRPIISDAFGRMYYFDNDNNQQISKGDLEKNYPVKIGKLDNPYLLSIFKPVKKPKYNPGDIAVDEDYPIEGVLILKFYYFDDSYNYCNAYLISGKWKYDTSAQQNEKRTVIEEKYNKKIATVTI
jgi:hypothetical protein